MTPPVNFELEKIVATTPQVDILFRLLKARKHNISNTKVPTKIQHAEFVKNHPYRVWYLVKYRSDYVGSAYVMKNNCISISLISHVKLFPSVLRELCRRHQPLKEIKSVRPPHFFINVAPSNREVQKHLLNLHATKIQVTYSLTAPIDVFN